MQPIIINISLAALFAAEFLLPHNVEAKENRICFSHFCYFSEHQHEQYAIEPWMRDSDYFYSAYEEIDSPVQKIEDWMKDIHHFHSVDIKEEIQLEKWMTNKNYFIMGLTSQIGSRSVILDTHRHSTSLMNIQK